MVEVTVLGISLQKDGNDPVLLLYPHNGRQIVSMPLGPLEAFAVSTALSEAEAPDRRSGDAPKPCPDPAPGSDDLLFRPVTHELLLGTLKAMDATIVEVRISKRGGEGCTGEIVIDGPGGRKMNPCRPSDGIALALRARARIMFSPSALAGAEDVETAMSALSEDIRTLVAARLLALPGAQNMSAYLEPVLASAMPPGREQPRKPVLSASHQIIMGEEKRDQVLGKALEETKKRLSPLVAGQSGQAGQPVQAGQGPETPIRPAASRESEERKQAAASVRGGQTVTGKINLGKMEAQPDADAGEVHEIEAVMEPGQTIVLPGPRTDGKAPTIRISLVRQTPDGGSADSLDAFLFPTSGVPSEVLGNLSLTQEDVKAVGNAHSEDERWTTLLRLLAPETKVPM